MKRIFFALLALVAFSSKAQTIPYVPKPAALFTSLTGLAGSWTPMLTSGGTTIPNVPQNVFGAYCSTDGTGNAGTWAPCGQTNSTPTACLTAATVTTPCVAFQGTFTGLGATGTTGVQTLYTSNAPASATFQFCPSIFIGAAGTAGTIQEQVSFTTPGGQSRTASAVVSTALTSTGSSSFCATIVAGANSSLSFAVLAVSGTGTPVWETEPVVLRIH